MTRSETNRAVQPMVVQPGLCQVWSETPDVGFYRYMANSQSFLKLVAPSGNEYYQSVLFSPGSVQEDQEYIKQVDTTEIPDTGLSDAGSTDQHREQTQGSHRSSL